MLAGQEFPDGFTVGFAVATAMDNNTEMAGLNTSSWVCMPRYRYAAPLLFLQKCEQFQMFVCPPALSVNEHSVVHAYHTRHVRLKSFFGSVFGVCVEQRAIRTKEQS